MAEQEQRAAARGRYLRPGAFMARVVNPLLMRVGAVPTLSVRGRRSGQTRSVPVNVLEHDGGTYLVAPRGDTHWVRNLRAAGECELRRRRRRERFRARELPIDERQPLIDAYLARWGSQVRAQWRELPDASQHPVFRLEPAG
jgi:deazaflavin-dependent oxidoreductase (nitroreductase family)